MLSLLRRRLPTAFFMSLFLFGVCVVFLSCRPERVTVGMVAERLAIVRVSDAFALLYSCVAPRMPWCGSACVAALPFECESGSIVLEFPCTAISSSTQWHSAMLVHLLQLLAMRAVCSVRFLVAFGVESDSQTSLGSDVGECDRDHVIPSWVSTSCLR